MALTYAPAHGDTIVPGAHAATERLSRVGGFIAGCGWAALLVVLNAVNGTPTSASDVTRVIKLAVAQGHTLTASGVATPDNLIAVARNDFGTQIQTSGWQSALRIYAGVKPVALGLSNASALGGPDSNVHGHYITVVGHTSSGDYIVSDPNTPQSERGEFVTYSPSQIANAQPFWAGVPTANVSGQGNQLMANLGSGPAGGLAGASGASTSGTSFFSWLQSLPYWQAVLGYVSDPMRIVKSLVGAILIWIGISIAFFQTPVGQTVIENVKGATKTALETAALA